MATGPTVAFFLRRFPGLPSFKLRYPDVAFVGSHGEIERPPIGREAKAGVLPGGIIESDQQPGWATRRGHCPDRRALWTLADVVNGLPIGRPGGIEGLVAR